MNKILILLFLCVGLSVNAQPRQDKPKQLNVCKTSQYLSDFTFWSYNSESGRWKSTRYGKNGKNPNASKHDITSLQTKIVERNGQKYYLLIHTRWYVGVLYPHLGVGTFSWKGREIYSLSEDDFNLLCNIPDGTHVLTLHSLQQCEIKENVNEKIKNQDDLFPTLNYYQKFVIRRENENTVRFKVPGGQRWQDNYQYGADDIKDDYYEVPLSTWKILDIINK